MKLTNLVVNQTAQNIMQQFGTDIEKARSGVYADTAKNRKLQRVGQQYGGKKQEEEEHGKPKGKENEPKGKQTRDERFSEDGIVGKDGGFNKQGKTYKRWADLREKVESGKATPEEKKEFAHLHNQYLNEKDRHAYEQSKQSDPKAKEPKYKTVDERRAEYKGKKEEGKEQKEKHEEELNQKLEKMSNDKKVGDIDFAFAGIGYYLVDHDPEIKELFDLGYTENSKKVQSLIDEKIIKESEEHQDEIKYALEKYGHDAVLKFITDNNDNTVSKRLAEKIIAHAIKPEKAEQKSNEEPIDIDAARNAAKKFFNVSGQNEREKWFISEFMSHVGFANSTLKRTIKQTSAGVKDTIKTWKSQSVSWNDPERKVMAEELQEAYNRLMPELENMSEEEYQKINNMQFNINAKRYGWK